jgi:DNA-binding HxlR family transcriptional regulator
MSGPKIAYQHFCPAARALEVIGEKWSLLIVRDLLFGPRRFNDLRRSLAAITPKWLSLRLRELEEAGILEREATNEREVWYSLTPKGQALSPVVEDLVVWGIDYALRPPRANEAIHAGRATGAFVTYLNRRALRLDHPVAWVVRFTGDRGYTIRFDGERWSRQAGAEAADVVLEMSPEAWVKFLTGTSDERRGWLAETNVEGTPEGIEEFARTLGRQETPAEGAAGTRSLSLAKSLP